MLIFKPNENGCWIVTSHSKSAAGYAQYMVNGKTKYWHRKAYETFVGPIPAGMFVCHHCDEPACINWEHLFLGTHSDNIKDAYRKGRVHPPSQRKLSEQQAKEILARRNRGEGGSMLAREYNIAPQTVCNIYKGRSWKHLQKEETYECLENH